MSHNRALPSAPLLRISSRLVLYAACLSSLVLFLTACDDNPTGVGVDVGNDPLQGGEPVTVDLAPTTLGSEREAPITGAVAGNTPEWFFAGRVDDPLAGRTEANGFLNLFQPVEELTGSLYNDPITDVSLRLSPISVYGDTTRSVTLALYDMPAPWDGSGARSDTTLASGEQIMTFELDPTQDTTFVPLPRTWINENEPVLRDTTGGSEAFLDAFAGFRIAHASGNAAVGFNRNDTALRLATSIDTTDFNGRVSLTTIERTPPETLPDDRALVQGGLANTLTFSYDFDAPPLDSLRGTPVNRAEFVLPVDTTLQAANTPDGFVRPTPSSYALIGRSVEGDQRVTLASELTIVDGALRFTGETPVRIFEEGFLRESAFSEFVVRPNASGGRTGEVGLDVAFFRLAPPAGASTNEGPRATVTVTPY